MKYLSAICLILFWSHNIMSCDLVGQRPKDAAKTVSLLMRGDVVAAHIDDNEIKP